MNSLKHRALSATAWSGADMLIRQGLQFVVSVVLARLLTPADFGTIALLSLFTGLAGAFIDSGFSAALIQRQDITQTDESTVFWLNLILGFLVSCMLWFGGNWIASFFAIPILEPLAGVMAVNLFVTALGSIHNTLLTKSLNFRALMKVGAFSSLASGTVAILMAARGWGIWALAAQALLATVLSTTLLWVVNPWRPKLEFSLVSFRKLFRFGSYLLGAGLLDIAYNRLYTVLIGKLFGVVPLGFYNRAEGTKQMPVNILTGILSRVAFPIFSASRGDADQLRRGVRLSVQGMMLVNVPIMMALASVADSVVLVLFGEAWRPTAPLLKILCFAGVFWPLHVINLNVLMAQGHANLFFRLEILKKVIGLGLLAVGVTYGVEGIAWSQVAFGVSAFVVNAYYTGKYLAYGVASQTRDFFPIFLIAAACFSFGVPFVSSMYSNGLFGTALVLLLAVVCYVASLIAFRVGGVRAVISLVLSSWQAKRRGNA